MERVGFIGLGNMGSGMAANIQKAGYPMVVYDIREEATKPYLERGASLGSSPADVAARSDVVLTSVPGPKEMEQVALGPEGILNGIAPGSVYLDLTTNRPSLIRETEPKFRERGAHLLDAPVSGGKDGAASGNLAVMVGGDPEVYERVKPLLDSFGDKVFHVGDIGCGCVAKLVHNMISRGVRLAFEEGMTLGVKAGVDAESLWEAVRRGALGRASFIHYDFPKKVLLQDNDPPTADLSISIKDISLATELGREFSVPLPIANLGEQQVIEGINRGWLRQDSSVLFRLQEEKAGVEVRAPNVDPEKAAKFITTHPETQ